MDEYISRETIRRTVLNYNPENPKKATCWAMMITDLLRDIDNLPAADVQPVNQWISINERLPESEKEVLVWYKYIWDAGFTSYGFGINVWYSNAKQWRDGCLLKGVGVLYWQPLPEPPKDGDNNG